MYTHIYIHLHHSLKGVVNKLSHIRQHNYPIPIFRSHLSDAQATSPSVRRWAVPWQVGSTCWPRWCQMVSRLHYPAW